MFLTAIPIPIPLPSCNPITVFLIPVLDAIHLPPPQPSLPLSRLPRCLFNSNMQIPKKPVSFCLSLLLPHLSPASFSSRIRPTSGFLNGKARGIHTAGFFVHVELEPEVLEWVITYFMWVCLGAYRGGFLRVGIYLGALCALLVDTTGAKRLCASYQMDKTHGTVLGDKSSLVQHMGSNNSGREPCIWSSSEGGCTIDIGKQIFCNRSLNMKNIVAVGFDMDYTLAQYKPETFETLAYEGTIRKLVNNLGYPAELLGWSFDWKYMVRGLVLDKKRGNILKMDRHKYVKIAYHGFKELSKEVKVGTYGNTLIRDSFDEPDYALIDTLFSLAEAYLFAQLVDLWDKNPEIFPDNIDYARMYKDVRAAVDLCHRDGTLKKMVAKDPKKYINEDTAIVPMLKMLRTSGRTTFLVTNSLWDYTNIVMNFLCENRTMEGSEKCNFDWLQYFDVVITGSAKPGFFHEDSRANLFEVESDTGMLVNTDNGSPMAQVGDTSSQSSSESLKKTKVYQGGNVGHLHKLLKIGSSSQVLYVGDHIYGDILRSKKVLGWRTMLVVPELEREVELLWELRDIRKDLQSLRNQRDLIEDKIHHINWSLNSKDVSAEEKQNLSSKQVELESQRELVRCSHQQAQRELHQKYHKVWGQLMKTGYQNSRFAHQVERFACLYTSQVSNLSLYSPDKYYRPSEDFMPHEFDIIPL